jgi:hypothetical protein
MGADMKEKDENGRVIPEPHMGPTRMYGLCADEEQQWRRWSPRPGDVVLVDHPDHGVWPGKVSSRPAKHMRCCCTKLIRQIIDSKSFYQGRSVPKGCHYFVVRVYDSNIEPYVLLLVFSVHH